MSSNLRKHMEEIAKITDSRAVQSIETVKSIMAKIKHRIREEKEFEGSKQTKAAAGEYAARVRSAKYNKATQISMWNELVMKIKKYVLTVRVFNECLYQAQI